MSAPSNSPQPTGGTTVFGAPIMNDARQDVALALALANQGRARGELVVVLRHRLLGCIRALTGPARVVAAARPTAKKRTGYASTMRQAIAAADAGGGAGPDPAQSLRALATAVDALARLVAEPSRT